jgi:hypothetical protein
MVLNPLHVFADYGQARRAATSASYVAWLIAGWYILALGQYGFRITIAVIAPSLLVAVIMALLGWRATVRPGPWKTFAVLAYVVFEILRMSIPVAYGAAAAISLLIPIVVLNFALIAFRGALAMRRLSPGGLMDVDIFS